MTPRSDLLRSVRRVIVKIGTGVLTSPGGAFDRNRFELLCADLATLAGSHELVVVSSGAIALGVERLGFKARPKDIPNKQACAAVGQSRLMRLYDDALGMRGLIVAQILLTHADIQSRTRYVNARHALDRLVERKVVPIINENDTVSVEELKFGDNDTLAGMVVDIAAADLLVILTDIDGVYTADPRSNPDAKKLDELSGVDDTVLAGASGSVSGVGTGGMSTKLRAAKRAGESGIPTIIAPGKRDGVLAEIFAGAPVGTLVLAPAEKKGSGRQRWIARDTATRGELRIDDGAVKAVVSAQKSLLPSGIREVKGTFEAGEPVAIADLAGTVVARGLVAYDSDDLRRIAGAKSADIVGILGFKTIDEAVHRDDLVVIAAPA